MGINRLLEEQLWCSGHKKYLLCKSKHNSAHSPFAQIVYVLQSLVPGIWQNPLPLTGPAHSRTVDRKHKTLKSVNHIV